MIVAEQQFIRSADKKTFFWAKPLVDPQFHFFRDNKGKVVSRCGIELVYTDRKLVPLFDTVVSSNIYLSDDKVCSDCRL